VARLCACGTTKKMSGLIDVRVESRSGRDLGVFSLPENSSVLDLKKAFAAKSAFQLSQIICVSSCKLVFINATAVFRILWNRLQVLCGASVVHVEAEGWWC
jgi:hypothetical protein